MVLTRKEMVEILSEEYPSIYDELREESWVGLSTLEIACFARYTQAQIDNADRGEVKRCFETARNFLLHGDRDLANAVSVSYLEHLNFHDGKVRRAWAKSLLPPALVEGTPP